MRPSPGSVLVELEIHHSERIAFAALFRRRFHYRETVSFGLVSIAFNKDGKLTLRLASPRTTVCPLFVEARIEIQPTKVLSVATVPRKTFRSWKWNC